jgi:hypothetical protein
MCCDVVPKNVRDSEVCQGRKVTENIRRYCLRRSVAGMREKMKALATKIGLPENMSLG